MLSDRFALHKPLYLSGFMLLGGALVFFPYVQDTSFWLILAFLQGFGSVASNTVAGIFIVERYEKSEWDERIGVMQTLYGVGQAIGCCGGGVVPGTGGGVPAGGGVDDSRHVGRVCVDSVDAQTGGSSQIARPVSA